LISLIKVHFWVNSPKNFILGTEPPSEGTHNYLYKGGYKAGRAAGFWSAGRGVAFPRSQISEEKSLGKQTIQLTKTPATLGAAGVHLTLNLTLLIG